MMDVIFFVLDGTGSLQVGDLSVAVSAGSIIDSPKGIPHGALNSGNGPLRLLVIKLPE
jgi:mannose-6-phosphate isomerase-like protein (cupin superfamily)